LKGNADLIMGDVGSNRCGAGAEKYSGHATEHGQGGRFEEELGGDVHAAGPERSTQADFGSAFQDRYHHDVGDSDRTYEKPDGS
jgi:hypothetical protein